LTADYVAAGRWDARDERITGEPAGALAYGYVISHVTFGIHTAGCRARIDATEVVANLVAGTFGIFYFKQQIIVVRKGREKKVTSRDLTNALGTTTSSVRIALVTGTTLADNAETTSETLSIGTANEARARITAVVHRSSKTSWTYAFAVNDCLLVIKESFGD